MFDIEIEKTIAASFLAPHQARRVLALLGNKRGRKKFIGMLPHNLTLDQKYSRPISNSDQEQGKLVELLKKLGAPSRCYIISVETSIDGLHTQLDEGVDQIFYFGDASILSCIPNKLGFYVSEDFMDIYLLHRK